MWYTAAMTPRDYLNMNGIFPDSPLVGVLRIIDQAFAEQGAPYAVIGGLAVARNGAPRTTHDIDILTKRSHWEKIRPGLEARRFRTSDDSAEDLASGIPVDVLFSGDDRGMAFALPEPEAVSEYDADVVELMRAHLSTLKPADFSTLHPGIRDEVNRIWNRVEKKFRKT